MTFGQKVSELCFQSPFPMSKIDGKIDGFFFSSLSIKNIELGKTFFLTSIFEPLYFLKSCLIVNELTLFFFHKIQWFECAQKFAFLK